MTPVLTDRTPKQFKFNEYGKRILADIGFIGGEWQSNISTTTGNQIFIVVKISIYARTYKLHK